ncbi:response regulator [Verrucomicrobia bacterium S94]|nr:response regulator [Verrucomicrobia bacterium S94]
MKILIAEDNAFSRTLLKKTLTKAGYKVVAAENGDAAWKILQQEDPPKLALLDWMMPGLSGIELCRKMRQIESPIPVYTILLTAKSDKEDVLEGFAAGADDFIIKPFDSGELLARIQVGRRLVEQQALMYCLIDSIPDPIYVKDSRGLYLSCNSAYARFVGLKWMRFTDGRRRRFFRKTFQKLHTWKICVFWLGELLRNLKDGPVMRMERMFISKP